MFCYTKILSFQLITTSDNLFITNVISKNYDQEPSLEPEPLKYVKPLPV